MPAGGGRGGLFGRRRCPSSPNGTRANLSRVAAAGRSPLRRQGWRGVMLIAPLSAPTGKRGGRDAGPSTALQISPFVRRDLLSLPTAIIASSIANVAGCCQVMRAPPSDEGRGRREEVCDSRPLSVRWRRSHVCERYILSSSPAHLSAAGRSPFILRSRSWSGRLRIKGPLRPNAVALNRR